MHGQQDDAVAAFFGGVDGREPDYGPGPWFEAGYEGDCSGCFAEIAIGDIIRADGEGGWQRQECCGSDERECPGDF